MSLPAVFGHEEEEFSDSPQVVSDSETEASNMEDLLDSHWRADVIFKLYGEEKFKQRRSVLLRKIYGWDDFVKGGQKVESASNHVVHLNGVATYRGPMERLRHLQRMAEELRQREDAKSKIFSSVCSGHHSGPTTRLESLQLKVKELLQRRESTPELSLQEEKEQQGPSEQVVALLRRYSASLSSFTILAKLRSSLG